MRRKLNGLRVLVTGASQGIGRALVVEAAKRGCKVLAAARSQPLLDELAAEVRAAGGTLETVAADITKPEDRAAMVAATTRHFGGLDVLVNNAGIGATCAMHGDGLAMEQFNGSFQHALHRGGIGLCLPAEEAGTIIFYGELIARHQVSFVPAGIGKPRKKMPLSIGPLPSR